jgi:hypothetical protein
MIPPVLRTALLTISATVLIVAFPATGLAQNAGSLDPMDKLRIHGERVYSPWSLASTAAYAGWRQARNHPAEWGHGGAAYGKRLGSALGYSAIHEALAFGLDASLHQDPRYFRSTGQGILRRTVHALRETIMTRTDSGGETVSAWRIGSAYGAAYLSNQWYPDRLNTAGLIVKQGSLQLGYDFTGNLVAEFWPDVKQKLLRRKP